MALLLRVATSPLGSARSRQRLPYMRAQADATRVVTTRLHIPPTTMPRSGLTDQNQKMTVAASAIAEKKTVGHRS